MTHITQTTIQGVKADHCEITTHHQPRPRRFIWHHVLPQVCGGESKRYNTVMLCDNCHYTIHEIMWMMVHFPRSVAGERYNRQHLAIAQRGYDAALAAGTLDKMPKES